jgi:predicted nucleotidyltransferase
MSNELTGVSQSDLDQILAKLKVEEPGLQALMLSGSFARGEGSPESDIDMYAVTSGEPNHDYYTWFVETEGKLRHFSIEVEKLQPYEAEPVEWSLSLPVEDNHIYLWATDEAKQVLGEDPTFLLRAKQPELEDLIEFARKVKRAQRLNDSILLRWAARSIAETSPGLLLKLNTVQPIHTPTEAIKIALNFSNSPEHYRQDFEVCYGLRNVSDAEIAEAALRLTTEMLTYLRQHNPDVDKQPYVSQYLADGTLERYLQGE